MNRAVEPSQFDLADLSVEALAVREKKIPWTWIIGISAVALFLGAWEIACRLGLVDPLFVSPPSAVLIEAYREFFTDATIYPHLYVSFIEAVAGFGLAALVGIPLGLLMGRYRSLRAILEPFVMAMYSTPRVALLPLLVLWIGIGLTAKVTLVFLGAVFPIIVNAQAGVESADPALVEAAVSFRATERQIFTKIMLPASLPFLIAGLRLSVGITLIMVVVAEMYASMAGVGYFIMRGGATYDTPKVFLGILILTLSGVVCADLLRRLERKIAPWRAPDRAR